MPKVFGIIGNPLAQSFSPQFFKEKFHNLKLENAYKRFELTDIKQFVKLIESEPNLSGLNVTSPYKEAVIPYLTELSLTAKEIGAVNTIKFSDGKLIGHNTDVIGFDKVISSLNLKNAPCLVLGTGGASMAVTYVLKNRNIRFLNVSRNPKAEEIKYENIDASLLKSYPVVINTTPLGMGKFIGDKPKLPYRYIGSDNVLIDLIYKPRTTAFLKEGLGRGARVKNGFQMLIEQAEASWKIWN